MTGAWSSQTPDSRYLVIIDSSNSVGSVGIRKIQVALSEPSQKDELAKIVTLIQYPTAIGTRVLNFNNSAEFYSHLSSLRPLKGSTDLNQIIEFSKGWSREYVEYGRKVIWISDGGGISTISGTQVEIVQKLETITSLLNWSIMDLSEQSKLSFLADAVGQYRNLATDSLGTTIKFDIPHSNLDKLETNSIFSFKSILGERENLLFNLAIFLSTSLAIIILFRAFVGRNRSNQLIQKRMNLLASSTKNVWNSDHQTSEIYWNKLPEILRSQVDKIASRLELSTRSRFLLLFFSSFPGFLILLALSGSFLVAILMGVVMSPLILKVIVTRTEKKEIQDFAAEFPGFLSLLSSGLKSGLSLEQGIDAYCQQNKGITAREFNRVLSEVKLGASFEDSLNDLVNRRNDEDLSWLVTAISIQKTVGGSLSSIIDTVLETIQSRGEVKREVRALSAEGKLSAYVLIALPIFIFSFLLITRRGYVEVLWQESIGLLILFLIGTLITIGWFWMRKVVNIKV